MDIKNLIDMAGTPTGIALIVGALILSAAFKNPKLKQLLLEFVPWRPKTLESNVTSSCAGLIDHAIKHGDQQQLEAVHKVLSCEIERSASAKAVKQ